jgi:hypothetical protein
LKNLYEIFDEVRKTDSWSEKVQILRTNNYGNLLSTVLQGAFHPAIRYTFSKDDFPEYTPDKIPAGMGYTTILTEIDRIYLFVVGSKNVSPDLTIQRRKEILIQMLEAMEEKEAEVFKAMILKDLSSFGITYKLAVEAFPGLLPNTPETETIIYTT